MIRHQRTPNVRDFVVVGLCRWLQRIARYGRSQFVKPKGRATNP